ncbi:unannotated protein [freshwater metagenome]|uniref:Unannotated protein n=1 Tax=freshwater metagenome TaxID=449393 RepID=A0A6J7EL20_9ZZZZ
MSTDGLRPVCASTSPGRNPTIHPFSLGRCVCTLMSMRFCPGRTVNGPKRYFRTFAPAGGFAVEMGGAADASGANQAAVQNATASGATRGAIRLRAP